MKIAKKILTTMLTVAISIPCFGGIPLIKKDRGSWARSTQLITAIDADYDDARKTLTVDFHDNFGNTNISLFNTSGNVIYSNVAEASSGTKIIVPLHGLSAGDYYLSITSVNGETIEGSFLVKQESGKLRNLTIKKFLVYSPFQ